MDQSQIPSALSGTFSSAVEGSRLQQEFDLRLLEFDVDPDNDWFSFQVEMSPRSESASSGIFGLSQDFSMSARVAHEDVDSFVELASTVGGKHHLLQRIHECLYRHDLSQGLLKGGRGMRCVKILVKSDLLDRASVQAADSDTEDTQDPYTRDDWLSPNSLVKIAGKYMDPITSILSSLANEVMPDDIKLSAISVIEQKRMTGTDLILTLRVYQGTERDDNLEQLSSSKVFWTPGRNLLPFVLQQALSTLQNGMTEAATRDKWKAAMSSGFTRLQQQQEAGKIAIDTGAGMIERNPDPRWADTDFWFEYEDQLFHGHPTEFEMYL